MQIKIPYAKFVRTVSTVLYFFNDLNWSYNKWEKEAKKIGLEVETSTRF
jgi:hypothetical protein